jgi:allantoin racemase
LKKIRILCPIAILPGWREGELRSKYHALHVSYFEDEFKAVKDPNTEIVYKEVPDAMGPHVEQYHESDLAGLLFAREAFKADQEGFDGVIIGCFCDPGVEEARELCDTLVMSHACAALHVASMLGNKFSIIICGRGHIETITAEVVRRYGLESKLASIRTLDVPPTGMNPTLLSKQDLETMNEKALKEAKKAIKEDGAEVIIAYAGSYEYLKKSLDVPVISPTLAALKMTEALVMMGLCHSKKTYPRPRIPHSYYLSSKPST